MSYRDSLGGGGAIATNSPDTFWAKTKQGTSILHLALDLLPVPGDLLQEGKTRKFEIRTEPCRLIDGGGLVDGLGTNLKKTLESSGFALW